MRSHPPSPRGRPRAVGLGVPRRAVLRGPAVGAVLGAALLCAAPSAHAVVDPGARAAPAPPSSVRAASARATLADAAYARALDQLSAGRHADALAALRRLQVDFPRFERMPAVQTRIAVLQEAPGEGRPLTLFLDALERRDAGDIDTALARLDAVATSFPEDALADDALYLAAYVRVMDRYAFADARETLLELGRRFPDTAYRDSAVYLDAIALEQLGRTGPARTALGSLRERHTALTLPFEFRWPRGNVTSRYWFDRAERRLGIIEQRLADASTLKGGAAARDAGDGRLRLDVSVAGRDMTLSLVPSPLVRDTDWLDAGLADRLPPAIGVYEGTVDGETDSWVRAVVRGGEITGLVEIDGTRHRLLPANLVGTLDYYLPKPGGGFGKDSGDGTTLAEMLENSDALVPPPALGGARSADGAAGEPALGAASSDVRAVPLSVVVDSQYDRYHAGDGLASALNDLNVADGIYRSLGFSLALDEVLTFDEARDPMAIGPVTLETLLRRFRAYRLAQRTLFEGSALTYLFSGNPKTDVTLGLAWIDTLCRTDGYDVGVTTPSAFGDVLLTHELGHSLGAQHDSDTECRTESDFLMWPNISERTPTTLSPCSAASVRRSLARSCLLDTVDLVLGLEDDGDAVRFLATNPDGALAVEATLAVETGAARRDGWPSGCRARTPTAADCALGTLRPGETRELVLPGPAGEAVAATLAAVGVTELDPGDNVVASGGGFASGVTGDAEADVRRDDEGRERAAGGTTGVTVADAGGGPTLGGGQGGGGAFGPGALGLGTAWLLGGLASRRRPAVLRLDAARPAEPDGIEAEDR